MKKVFADVIGSSKKRKRMDHTKTKENVIERKKKISNQEDVVNAVLARQKKSRGFKYHHGG